MSGNEYLAYDVSARVCHVTTENNYVKEELPVYSIDLHIDLRIKMHLRLRNKLNLTRPQINKLC